MVLSKCGNLVVGSLLKKSVGGRWNGGLVAQMRMMSAYRSSAVAFKEPNYSELPIPEGSWDSYYKKQNRKATRHLIMGGGFFLFTLSVLYGSGLVTLNHRIPNLPDDFRVAGGCVPPPPKC